MSISDMIDATEEALNRLRDSAKELNWSEEFLNAQVALVRSSAPNIPGVEMHDSTCEYASAYCLLFREKDLQDLAEGLCSGGFGAGDCPDCGYQRSEHGGRW